MTDTGPGIASEELDRVFEAFVQTAAGQQVREGSGLGLSICRKFVQLMGGEIRVESRLGHGTTFSFDIAVQQGQARHGSPDESDRVLKKNAFGRSKCLEEGASERPRIRLTSDMLAGLPTTVLRQLRQASEALHIEAVHASIEQIRAYDVNTAKALGSLVERYRFDIVQRILKEVDDDSI